MNTIKGNRLRARWELNVNRQSPDNSIDLSAREQILSIIDNKSLSIRFQAIYSLSKEKVFGYEALTVLKDNNFLTSPAELFQKAKACNVIDSLDFLCRENAISQASLLGIRENGAYLFVNICPETLMSPTHRYGITAELIEEWGLSRENIILEITEETAIKNYDLFRDTVSHYRKAGFKIAIDDFGAGYGGLKMLSIIEPDFIKIDRHFISDIDKAAIKFNLVDAIVTSCHRIGIKIIAEGVETKEEFEIIRNFGIDLLQGYYISRPGPGLSSVNSKDLSLMPPLKKNKNIPGCLSAENCYIRDIAEWIEPIHPAESVFNAFQRFIKNPNLRGLPITEDGRIIGILHRNRFLEDNILGKYGFGMALNSFKIIRNLMEYPAFIFEGSFTVEEVAQRIQKMTTESINDDICITVNGKYFGIVTVKILLDAMTEKNLLLAKGSNPLSGLPGNEFIHREISKRLAQKVLFDVIYIDIDNFKPYNDCYGFERGDCVIKGLAGILKEVLNTYDDNFSFLGHIGGDDFIILTRSRTSISIAEKIISDFESQLRNFHSHLDFKNEYYNSENRAGKTERMNLLSLSIAIVSTEVHKINSVAHLSSIAAEVKKVSKSYNGSSIVRDRRLYG